jgi:hypothetical protein
MTNFKMNEEIGNGVVTHWSSIFKSNSIDEKTTYESLEEEGLDQKVIDCIIDKTFGSE